MIRAARVVALLTILGCPVSVRAQDAASVLDSLMDTENVPKPLLYQFAKAYEEDWVCFGAGLHQNYFFIPRTIKATGHGTKTVWGVNLQGADSTDWMSSRPAVIEQRQRAHEDPDKYAKYLLTKIQWEVDCAGQRMRMIKMIDYDEDGGVIYSGQFDEKLAEPVPDTNAEGLVCAFCHPRTRITFRDLVNTPLGVQVADKH